MRVASAFKRAFIAYLAFAGVFLLCLNVQHSMSPRASEHGQEESMKCATGASCDSMIRHHVYAIAPISSLFAAVALLGFGVVISFLFAVHARDGAGFLYMKLWRDSGGVGIHFFDFLQCLFARGILNQKTYNFVVA